MQTFGSLLSLLLFLSAISAILRALPPPAPPDDSLYRIQLAEDEWRVLSLRGRLADYPGSRDGLEDDLGTLGGQTGMCIYLEGIRSTNCRDAPLTLVSARIRRTVIENGMPRSVTLTIGR
ncbi:MAG: hypothetical protein U0R44_05900 [Candidatus Micrarchaeia archaeon]